MAESGESGDVQRGRGKKRGGVRAKKMSTRIDMTPMVDLGFLLVTFFILTTSMQKPKAMPVVIPEKPSGTIVSDPPRWDPLESMTILLGSNDKIFYYMGENDKPAILETSFKDIRKFLTERNNEVLEFQKANGRDQHGINVLIKPMDESKYEDVVNILDEMRITQIRSYAIEDVQANEIALVRNKTSNPVTNL